MPHTDTEIDRTFLTSTRPQREPGTEPLPGYRLLAPLGQGGFSEVWKCEAPGGLLKAIKFIPGSDLDAGREGPAQEELRAIERIKTIRHPFLLSLERVEQVGNELVIVLELADRNLEEVLHEEQQAGRCGLARERLLGYLREAAEALDLLNLHHDLQHLDIKPRNLFLVGNHVKVGDFGLVSHFQDHEPDGPSPERLGSMTPVYAAPELFQNALSRHCDQYSLAIVYQELLTGTRPFNGKNARQLLLQHLQEEPNLEPLGPEDRAVVARALAKDPADRFPSCAAFIAALSSGHESCPTAPPSTSSRALAPAGESLADLRLLGCIRRTPLSEVHRAQAADGSSRLVQVLFGHTGDIKELENRLAALQHPALVPFQVGRDARGSLVLIRVPGGRPLRDRFRECVAADLPGIPRAELLGYLRAATEALASLFQQFSLAHLGLTPHTMLLNDGQLQLADFGLVQILWLPVEEAVVQLSTRYAAPELLTGKGGAACDQYSLALIYHEMLTGSLPAFEEVQRGFRRGPRRVRPLLDRLPEADRPVLARALDPDPSRRWEQAVDLVRALEAAPCA